MGPPLRHADFEVMFDRGIDNCGSWLNIMKENKIVTQGGAWYKYVDTETGEEHKFQSKEFPELLKNDPKLEEQIYNKICEATIREYKSASEDVDNLVVDDQVIGD